MVLHKPRLTDRERRRIHERVEIREVGLRSVPAPTHRCREGLGAEYAR